jgi:hypothetical protein
MGATPEYFTSRAKLAPLAPMGVVTVPAVDDHLPMAQHRAPGGAITWAVGSPEGPRSTGGSSPDPPTSETCWHCGRWLTRICPSSATSLTDNAHGLRCGNLLVMAFFMLLREGHSHPRLDG